MLNEIYVYIQLQKLITACAEGNTVETASLFL